MKDMKNIYIVREYMLVDDYGGVRIDEEAVFSTLEEAKDFLNALEDKEAEGDDFLLFRIEIVECALGQTNTYLRKWVYNIKGELVDTLPPPHNASVSNELESRDKFEIGDIVHIVPKIKNKLSPSTKGTYGVIVEIPLVDEHSMVGKKEEAKREYILYFITDKGLIDHVHAVECALSMPNAEVPAEFRILELISMHLKGEKKLPESLIVQLLNDNVFVKNINIFDFHDECIKDIFTIP